MRGPLLMSTKERRRLAKFELVASGTLTLGEAALSLDLSYRQCRRSYQRFKASGDAGLVHRRRGTVSNRRKPASVRVAVLEAYRERYEVCGPTLAAELLREEGLAVDHETLRRWLLAEGLWRKSRKRNVHRTRRERRRQFGALVQMDGSPHAWFGPDHKDACLMNMVDDATGTTLSRLANQETTEVAMETLWRWIDTYGIPQALYTDKKTVFVTDREPTPAEQLAGQKPLTTFGRACEKLGIEIITAHSPQAKGRVERNHGVYQDRLVKLLALREITTIEAANVFLADGFVANLNAKFTKCPAEALDAHIPVPGTLDLAEVFCWEDTRQVAKDWTVRHDNGYYQIAKENSPRPKPKDTVVVRTRLDGTRALFYRGHALNAIALPAPPPPPETKVPPKSTAAEQALPAKTQPKKTWRPNCT